MPVGGAETLLVQLIHGLDRDRFEPELCCLKSLGPLGEQVARETPAHSWLWRHKLDPTILLRLEKLFRRQKIDAVITVGAGDKMFWGRLAAYRARVPVIASALHSTGWPDQVERVNRWLTSITDAFIGVADAHGRYLVESEGFPADKVHVAPNGVDIRRFRFLPASRAKLRAELGIAADAPVCGVVAAQRPEKNLHLFLEAAARVRKQLPEARFMLVGDGPERESLEAHARRLGVREEVFFLGTRNDIPQVLSAMDLFGLTSDNEASPVSILEAMCCGRPVVATNVGSISESVQDGFSGILVEPGDVDAMSQAWLAILANHRRGRQMGRIGREAVVTHSFLNRMVESYEDLITSIYQSKCSAPHLARDPAVQDAGLHARGEETISPLDAEVVHVEESDEQEVMQPAS
jgi:glycosyltransferase involved in cell wall biosynthesis